MPTAAECFRCLGPMPRFASSVDRGADVVRVCSWKCAVLVRAADGDAEAMRIARHYGWSYEESPTC